MLKLLIPRTTKPQSFPSIPVLLRLISCCLCYILLLLLMLVLLVLSFILNLFLHLIFFFLHVVSSLMPGLYFCLMSRLILFG